MGEIKDYQLLQTRFNLSNTFTQIRYTIFNDTLCDSLMQKEQNRPTPKLKECLQMWVASVVSVKVLQCLGW